MANFVLVHGLFHGGWCFRRVAKLLRNQGHDVFTPTLTGVGERSHLLNGSCNLDMHVMDIVNVLRFEDLTDVVLCGHSFGGFPITGAADAEPERVGALVYLDAFVPGDGDSNHSLVSEFYQRYFSEGTGETGYSVAPVGAAVMGVRDPADIAWIESKCTPHPYASFRQSLRLTGAYTRVKKRVYIVATGWDVSKTPYPAYYERFRNTPGWTVYSEPCSHDMMVDAPERLAEILVASAA